MSRIQLESDRGPDNTSDSDIDIKLEQIELMIVYMSKNLISRILRPNLPSVCSQLLFSWPICVQMYHLVWIN